MKKFLSSKKPIMLFLMLMSMTMLVSCSGGGPEGVAKKFLELTNKGEFEKAKEYCDEDTAALIGMMENMAKDKIEEMKDNNAKIVIISSDVNEEEGKAKVTYKSIEEDQKEEDVKESQLDLVKVDGDWKVTIDKENMKKEQ